MMFNFFNKRKEKYFFHHVPKCGGTSFRIAFENWFNIVEDYHPGKEKAEAYIKNRVDISTLSHKELVCGHYGVPHLFERYPEIRSEERYRVFTFLRNPLDRWVSQYFYREKMGVKKHDSLEEHLFSKTNSIAENLDCIRFDFDKVLENYDFIGLVEYGQASLDGLARKLGKKKVVLPISNRSKRSVVSLDKKIVDKFVKKNHLDYEIFEYAKKRMEKLVGS